MISDTVKQAIQEEYFEHGRCRHTDAGHCHSLIIAGALWRTDEFITDEEDYQEALYLVMDAALSSLVLRGFIEPSGIDENGEMTYGATAKGNQAVKENRMDFEGGNGF